MSLLTGHYKSIGRRMIASLIALAFLCQTTVPVYAQSVLNLPPAGVRVGLSPQSFPPVLKGIKVFPADPFRFDFILDKGEVSLTDQALKDESARLIKYFLAALTIPTKDLWVNLSPYEKDRIVPEAFGQTQMGRDLLAEDYLLKQITASLVYPEDELGKKFWERVYAEAQRKFGTSDIPVDTFNKVWIVPEKAVVYENAKAGTAYVVESRLKVLLEQDYFALAQGAPASQSPVPQNPSAQGSSGTLGLRGTGEPEMVNALGSQIIRDIVIPELTREVNEGKNFAKLRQIYHSLILATWYKKKIKDSILNQVYTDKNKVVGVNIDDPQEKQKIYERYLQAFKQGVYNYIKEDYDPTTKEIIPRKYFSGGAGMNEVEGVLTTTATPPAIPLAGLSENAVLIQAGAGVVGESATTKAVETLIKNPGFAGGELRYDLRFPTQLVEALKKADGISGPIRILDIGSANGGISIWTAKQDERFQVLGLEHAPNLVQRANMAAQSEGLSRERMEFRELDVTRGIDLPDHSVEGVILHRTKSALNSKSDQRFLIQEVARVLKPGGYISFIDDLVVNEADPEGVWYKQRYEKHRLLLERLFNEGLISESYREFFNDTNYQLLLSLRTKEKGYVDDLVLSDEELFQLIKSNEVKIRGIGTHEQLGHLKQQFEEFGLASEKDWTLEIPLVIIQHSTIMKGVLFRKSPSRASVSDDVIIERIRTLSVQAADPSKRSPLRYSFYETVRREKRGKYSVQVNPNVVAKRRTQYLGEGMKQAFDPTMFNYTQVAPEEVLSEEKIDGINVSIIVNINPWAEDHFILVPEREAGLPQYLDKIDIIRIALAQMSNSRKQNLKIVYNSIGNRALSSINHLHLQGFYYGGGLDGQDLFNDGKLPVEMMTEKTIASIDDVEIATLTDYPAQTLVLKSKDQWKLAQVVFNYVSILNERNIRYTILFTKSGVMIFPQREEFKSAFGNFMAGEVIISTEEKLNQVTEEDIQNELRNRTIDQPLFAQTVSALIEQSRIKVPSQADLEPAAGQAAAATLEDFARLITEIDGQPSKSEDLFILSNENRQAETLEKLKSHPRSSNGVYIGFSGMFNLDMIAARQPAYAIVGGIDKGHKVLYGAIRKTILDQRILDQSKSIEQRREEFLKLLIENFERDQVFFYKVPGIESNVSHIQKLRQQFLEKERWMASDESFEYIQRMFAEGRIADVNLDIRDYKRAEKIAQWIKQNGLVVDSIYTSNIYESFQEIGARWDASPRGEFQKEFFESLKFLAEPSTIVIYASHDIPSEDEYPVLQVVELNDPDKLDEETWMRQLAEEVKAADSATKGGIGLDAEFREPLPAALPSTAGQAVSTRWDTTYPLPVPLYPLGFSRAINPDNVQKVNPKVYKALKDARTHQDWVAVSDSESKLRGIDETIEFEVAGQKYTLSTYLRSLKLGSEFRESLMRDGGGSFIVTEIDSVKLKTQLHKGLAALARALRSDEGFHRRYEVVVTPLTVEKGFIEPVKSLSITFIPRPQEKIFIEELYKTAKWNVRIRALTLDDLKGLQKQEGRVKREVAELAKVTQAFDEVQEVMISALHQAVHLSSSRLEFFKIIDAEISIRERFYKAKSDYENGDNQALEILVNEATYWSYAEFGKIRDSAGEEQKVLWQVVIDAIDAKYSPRKKQARFSPNEAEDIVRSRQQSDVTLGQVQDTKGGIDLDPDKLDLQFRNDDGEINFEIDPALLQKLQDAPGFTPQIINIQPSVNVYSFLGIENETNSLLAVNAN